MGLHVDEDEGVHSDTDEDVGVHSAEEVAGEEELSVAASSVET